MKIHSENETLAELFEDDIVYSDRGFDDEGEPLRGGDHVAWGDFTPREYAGMFGHTQRVDLDDDAVQPLLLIRWASYGDYDDSCQVERSNYRSLLRDFEEHVVTSRGGWGTEGLLVPLDIPVPEELAEVLDALWGYPVYDELDLIDLEVAMADEAWENFGRDDMEHAVRRELADVEDFDLTDYLDERNAKIEDMQEAVPWFLDHPMLEAEFEAGGGVYFVNIEEGAKHIARFIRVTLAMSRVES